MIGTDKQLRAMMEAQIKEQELAKDRLAKKWAPYVEASAALVKKNEGRDMTALERRNVAQVLENCASQSAGRSKRSWLNETTYGSDISFLGVQLPIVAALLPSLVLNKIGLVQSLDRRTGSVFYMDVKYGQAKGAITSGSTMMSATTGHNSTVAGRRYASELVEDETLATGDGAHVTYTGTLAYPANVAGTVVITDGVETFTDNGAGVLESDASGGTDGTISTAGVYNVTFATNVVNGVAITASYQYDYEKIANGAGVPEVNFSLTSSSLTAIDFPLRAKYSVGAAIDLEKAHGLNLEDEVTKYLAGEIKFEIDHYGIDLIEAAAMGANAATAIGPWDASFADGQSWFWKKFEFINSVEKGSNNIITKTKKAVGNFIVCGNDIKRVIVQLGDHFKPASDFGKIVPTGPYELGALDGMTVIHDPFMTASRYVVGFKGDQYLFAGMIYAPYIPLFTTPTLVTSDIQAQKGFLSASGFKMLNEGMYTYGTVTGLI